MNSATLLDKIQEAKALGLSSGVAHLSASFSGWLGLAYVAWSLNQLQLQTLAGTSEASELGIRMEPGTAKTGRPTRSVMLYWPERVGKASEDLEKHLHLVLPVKESVQALLSTIWRQYGQLSPSTEGAMLRDDPDLVRKLDVQLQPYQDQVAVMVGLLHTVDDIVLKEQTSSGFVWGFELEVSDFPLLSRDPDWAAPFSPTVLRVGESKAHVVSRGV